MKVISIMSVAIIIVAGLLGIIGQTEAYGSESKVTFSVPVHLSGLTSIRPPLFHVGMEIPVQCSIRGKGATARYKGQGRAIVRVPAGSSSSNVKVVVRRSSPGIRLLEGDSYQCSFALPPLPRVLMGTSAMYDMIFSSSVRSVTGTLSRDDVRGKR